MTLRTGRRLLDVNPLGVAKVDGGTASVNAVIHRLSTITDDSVLFVTIRATWQQLPATSGLGRFVCDLVPRPVNRC
jgi:hypothetical protein